MCITNWMASGEGYNSPQLLQHKGPSLCAVIWDQGNTAPIARRVVECPSGLGALNYSLTMHSPLWSTSGDVSCSSLPVLVTPASRGSHHHISSQHHSPSQMPKRDHSSLYCLITEVSVSGSKNLAVALMPLVTVTVNCTRGGWSDASPWAQAENKTIQWNYTGCTSSSRITDW